MFYPNFLSINLTSKSEAMILLEGKIIPILMMHRRKRSIFFYCRKKGSENLRFSGEKRLLSIRICAWFLFKNIKKFILQKIADKYLSNYYYLMPNTSNAMTSASHYHWFYHIDMARSIYVRFLLLCD